MFHVVAMAILTSLALTAFAVMLSVNAPNHFWAAVVFMLLCLGTFHFVFWLTRMNYDDRSLKAIDFVYLGIGFVGVYGVADVQEAISFAKVQPIISEHIAKLEELNPCKDYKEKKVSSWKEADGCWTASVIIRHLKDGRTKGYYIHLDAAIAEDAAFLEKEFEPFVSELKVLSKKIEEAKADFVNTLVPDEVPMKILAYYLLCIALSLRITKVTAELWMARAGSAAKTGQVRRADSL
jgi:hypothetical protein